MAPDITSATTGVLFENELEIDRQSIKPQYKSNNKYVRTIVWSNVIAYTALHIGALYGCYLIFASAKIATTIFAYILYMCSGIGITSGAHRLWSHKAYKANFPLRVLLMIFSSMAYQYSILEWSRNHRVHHKYSETDADPHNAGRGFWFSHIGWQLLREHPDVEEKRKCIDMSDLEADPVVAFQTKHRAWLMPFVAFVVPTLIPVYFWNETFCNAFFVPTLLRWAVCLNMTFLINSAAHIFGGRPYDKHIGPTENIAVAVGAWGEGWHNYHHVFPWDYKAAELGNYRWNAATAFIDFFAKIGWAYDLKRVSTEIVQQRCGRTGDGSHDVWGWGDKDQSAEEREAAIIEHPKKQK